MKHKPMGRYFFLILLLLLGLANITPVQAGDPDDTIGPADPTLFVCVDKNSHLLVNIESDAFDSSGTYDPEIEVDVEQVEKDCKEAEGLYVDADFTTEYLRQSRIEGYVFEFHPDPNGPAGWTAVRSRDVPVVASGPSFEAFRGSEKDGLYFFDNLGAGPVTLNLRLPPDAHPINSNITVMTTSFPDDLWEVDLGFYRGDTPPEYIEDLRLPADHKRHTLIPDDTILEFDESGLVSEMPNVGSVLPQDQPISTIALAAVILVILPAAGIYKLRRKRSED